MEVVLEQMLAAREARSMRQSALNHEYGLPIISFSMNIPGPIKDSPLIRRGLSRERVDHGTVYRVDPLQDMYLKPI